MPGFVLLLGFSIGTIAVAAFIVGWRRPPLPPKVSIIYLATSVLIHSICVTSIPGLQRDFLTSIFGVVILGFLFGGFLFLVIVKVGELVRVKYPHTMLFQKLVRQIRR